MVLGEGFEPTISISDISDGSDKTMGPKSIPFGLVCDAVRRARNQEVSQTVLVDVRTCDLTLSQVMAAVRLMAAGLPGHEVFMDGDDYAIVARRRVNANNTKGEVC